MTDHKIRCGDIVRHAPSGEEWVVAWADYSSGYLAWCGWPNGQARIAECSLVRAATDEEHASRLVGVLGCGDSRAATARRLYSEVT